MIRKHALPEHVELRLAEGNPWWAGRSAKALPAFKRWPFEPILAGLKNKLAPVILLRGPRRVGKTTLQDQTIRHLIEKGGVRPNEVMHVQFDDLPDWRSFRKFSKSPILDIAYWFEENVLKTPFNDLAREGRSAYLFFDEVQGLPSWAPQIKSLVDHAHVQVLVTGSSALHIGLGKESLAGRVSQISVGPLRLWEVGAMGGLDLPPYSKENGTERLQTPEFWRGLIEHGKKHAGTRLRAFRWFSERGGYPLAHERRDVPWEEMAANLRDTVINRVIQNDLRLGEGRGSARDPRLIEETFRMGCRYSGQYPSPPFLANEIKRVLHGNVGPQRVSHYLRFLDQAMLLKLVPPLELRLKRRRGYDKICLCDHGLRKAWLGEDIPLDAASLDKDPDAADLAGRLVEGAVGYFLGGIPELDVSHYPARTLEPEVDFILTAGDRRIPVEVKYRKKVDAVDDTDGLKRFMERPANRSAFGILVTREETEADPDPRVLRMPASTLLLLR